MHELSRLASGEQYLFTSQQLRVLAPGLSSTAFSTLLSRLVNRRELIRVCRGVYLYPKVEYPRGLVLYHTATLLRADAFNYLSLESALSDLGLIRQILMQRITLMSSGRRQTVSCGVWGDIEWIHTAQRPNDVADQLTYDARIRLWRANEPLALRDMRRTGRSLDLLENRKGGETDELV